MGIARLYSVLSPSGQVEEIHGDLRLHLNALLEKEREKGNGKRHI